MYKVTVNDQFAFDIENLAEGYSVDGINLEIDAISNSSGKLHVIYNHKSYRAEIIRFDHTHKTVSIKVNSNVYNINIRDKFDELLHSLGLDKVSVSQIAELKAPMPGLVLKVFVKVGDEVLKGDSLFILEAMKMENIIKAPANVTVKSILINSTDKVERNQILMTFC